MSRREEVEAKIKKFEILGLTSHLNSLDALARTLADEVDARDAIIDKLIAMLEPGVTPPKSHVACDCVGCRQYKLNEERYALAWEIAGRVKT